MIKDDGRVLHFTNPKVQASLSANTFAISGNCEDKRKLGSLAWLGCDDVILTLHLCTVTHAALTELLPGIFNQLVTVGVSQLLC